MRTVLVVDDEPILADVLIRFLKKLGCTPTVTESADLAMRIFDAEPFDLVLMDVHLPERDGFDIAKEMMERNPGQRIIMVSGLDKEYVSSRSSMECLNVASILSKPFSFDEFRMTVMQTLEGVPN